LKFSVFSPFKTAAKYLFKKPITFNFPPEHQWTDRWRGRHLLDINKCISCGICERMCPNRAITMTIKENGKKYPQIDYARCCFCGLCADSCPTKALRMTDFPILVTMSKGGLKYGPDALSNPPSLQMPETKSKGVIDWARSRSLWVINYFTGCGFIEAVPWVSSAFDMERFGMIAAPSPRSADVFMIAGYVTVKTLKRILRIYEQMPNPKFVMVLGNCPMDGGTYWDSYHTIKRIDDYIPVDLYIAGCPPRPESIGVAAVMAIKAIQAGYKGRGEEYFRTGLPKYYEETKEELGKNDEPWISLGPQHPATGNLSMKIKVEGERIDDVRLTIGYLHRGFEKLMEYRTWYQNIMLVQRICVLDGASYEVVYCEAVEKLAGIEIPERAKYLRVIQAELSRIQSHLLNIGLVASALGFDTMTRIAWGDREKILHLLELMSGGRVYQIYNVIGGVRRDVPDEFKNRARKVMEFFEKRLKEYDDLIFKNATVITRTGGKGVIDPEDAWKLDITGPNLRASGIGFDIRKSSPYAAYQELDFDVPVFKDGDVYHRILLRRREIEESMHIISQALDKLPEGRINTGFKVFQKIPEGEAMHCVESARGELCFHIVSDGSNKPYRVKVRGPTFDMMLSLLPKLLKGEYIADVNLILWSLDNCPADHDR